VGDGTYCQPGKVWVRYPDVPGFSGKEFKLNAERNNGRAAMMGIYGMIIHEALTGALPPHSTPHTLTPSLTTTRPTHRVFTTRMRWHLPRCSPPCVCPACRQPGLADPGAAAAGARDCW